MANSTSVLGFALLALPLLISPALGQGAGPKPRPTQGPIGVRSESTESADGGDAESIDTIKARMKRNSAQPRLRTPKGHCRFELSIRPEKLLPGQSGKGKVLMIFQGDAVLEESANFQMDSLQTQSLLSVGPMTRLPASLSTVAEAYRGRPVYDNWAIMEFPVTMSPDAPLGSKQTHTIKANFELHDGKTGQSIGEYEQRLTFSCEVGAKADPFVRGLANREANSGASEEVAAAVETVETNAKPSANEGASFVADMTEGHIPGAEAGSEASTGAAAPMGGVPGPGVRDQMGVLTYVGIFVGIVVLAGLVLVILRRSP